MWLPQYVVEKYISTENIVTWSRVGEFKPKSTVYRVNHTMVSHFSTPATSGQLTAPSPRGARGDLKLGGTNIAPKRM